MRPGEESFFAIYEPGGVGSGVGSEAGYCRPLIEYLSRFVRRHGIRTVLDYGCGDWQWAKLVDWADAEYLGVDMVPVLIERLRCEYGGPRRRFELVPDELPAVDLVICKDVAIHLPIEDVAALATKFSRAARHVLWVNSIAPNVNVQIPRGGCRGVDMGAPPFSVPGEHELRWGDAASNQGLKSVFHQGSLPPLTRYRLTDVAPILAHGALPDRWWGYVPEFTYDVPRRLHFIWIGSPLPAQYRENVLGFARLNPRHEIVLWVDHPCAVDGVTVRSVAELPMVNRDLYDAESNPGARADIARIEIVHAHGGTYLDIDTIALRPFDERIGQRAWVAACPYMVDRNVCNGFFSMPKASTFLRFVLDCMRRTRGETTIPRRTGGTMLTACVLSAADEQIQVLDTGEIAMGAVDGYVAHQSHANWQQYADWQKVVG